MPFGIASARAQKCGPLQGPSRDRLQTVLQTVVKNGTDCTDREEFEEVTELNPFSSRSVRSVPFFTTVCGTVCRRSLEGTCKELQIAEHVAWVLSMTTRASDMIFMLKLGTSSCEKR